MNKESNPIFWLLLAAFLVGIGVFVWMSH